uniref:Uncharacterized protein LOC114344232 isoform X1 n=1 Tax=Diabrotica virgifera virgifera TaxID=50390 RepID=A0A6P7GLU5_DIAVI
MGNSVANEQTVGFDVKGWRRSLIVYYVSFLLAAYATFMLGIAFVVDRWEKVTWDRNDVDFLANGTECKVEWLLDRTVAAKISTKWEPTIAFLAPMRMGMWTLCVSLSDEEINQLGKAGFPTDKSCFKKVSCGLDGEWHHRMKNLSMIGEMVCMLILGIASIIGGLAVPRNQTRAVLVIGLLYLLAACFALVVLTGIHLNRPGSRSHMEYGVVSISEDKGDLMLIEDLLPARVFTYAWSLDLGWAGVMLCAMGSVFWILLSKRLKVNPIYIPSSGAAV